MNIEFLFGVFCGMALVVFGLVAFEHFEMWQERKRRKKGDL